MCIGTYEEEVYLEEIDDYITCEFEYNIDFGQKEITSDPPEKCQPAIEPNVEILSAVSHDGDINLLEDEILELVEGGEEGLMKRILKYVSNPY